MKADFSTTERDTCPQCKSEMVTDAVSTNRQSCHVCGHTWKIRRRRPMSPMAARIRRKYTRVVKIGSSWDARIQIDHQGFTVCEQTTKRRAQWFARQTAIALARLISNETK